MSHTITGEHEIPTRIVRGYRARRLARRTLLILAYVALGLTVATISAARAHRGSTLCGARR